MKRAGSGSVIKRHGAEIRIHTKMSQIRNTGLIPVLVTVTCHWHRYLSVEVNFRFYKMLTTREKGFSATVGSGVGQQLYPDPDPLVRGADPDPRQNVTEPEHSLWSKTDWWIEKRKNLSCVGTLCSSKYRYPYINRTNRTLRSQQRHVSPPRQTF
jgi:hypothetical protein